MHSKLESLCISKVGIWCKVKQICLPTKKFQNWEKYYKIACSTFILEKLSVYRGHPFHWQIGVSCSQTSAGISMSPSFHFQILLLVLSNFFHYFQCYPNSSAIYSVLLLKCTLTLTQQLIFMSFRLFQSFKA